MLAGEYLTSWCVNSIDDRVSTELSNKEEEIDPYSIPAPEQFNGK